MFKLVLAYTMDPFGPFWGAHPTKKYVHTKAHPLENFRRKNALFWTQAGFTPGGVPNVKIVKNLPIKVQLPQKSIYSTPMHFKSILWPES